MEDVVDFSLNIGYQVDVAHDRDLEDFLSAISDNDEQKVMVKV